ncbi:MAG TPA: toll/interleukin-1 receptor domain-containing protein [Bacteroidia bacterium]|nr:toll/interleukin-1 receptor domain-containing protein [Bacteroidia bacterium]
MKHEIFISYSHKDINKIKLLVKELNNHPTFKPLVIASDREVGKLLAEKVINGIKKAEIIIPVITERSISEQWINQEIGFATAIGKTIIPIIDNALIDDLKGFIHKQIDLPYSYNRKSTIGQENKNFIACFKILLHDIEKLYIKNNTKPEKSDFEKSLEIMDSKNAELEFQEKREAFRIMPESIRRANIAVLELFNELGDKSARLSAKNSSFHKEQLVQKNKFALLAFGYSFSIVWNRPYSNVLTNNILDVMFWEGNISIHDNTMYHRGVPNRIKNESYTLDIDKNEQLCWRDVSSEKEFTSSKIIDNCIAWLVSKAT